MILSIKDVLMDRGMTEEEAEDLINEAKADLAERLADDDDKAYNICEEWFGLEPDYVMELI